VPNGRSRCGDYTIRKELNNFRLANVVQVKEIELVAADDGSRTNPRMRDGAKDGWESDTLMPYMSVRDCVLLFMKPHFKYLFREQTVSENIYIK